MKMKSFSKIALAVMIGGVGVSTISTKAEATTSAATSIATTKSIVDLTEATYKVLSKILVDTINNVDKHKEGHRKEDDVINSLTQIHQKFNAQQNAIGSFLFQKQQKGQKLTTTERNKLYNANHKAYNDTLYILGQMEKHIRNTSAASYGDFGKIKGNILTQIQKEKDAVARFYGIVKTNIGKAK